MQPHKFNVICDSAWGSSGKGAAAARLAAIFGVRNASSCNYPNAGHSTIFAGTKTVWKVLPSAACLGANIGKLWLGPGAAYEREQATKEIRLAALPVIAHARAIEVTAEHKAAEAPGGGQSTEHISSTMSGSGAAYSHKAMRRRDVQTAGEFRIVPEHLSVLEPAAFNRAVRTHLRCDRYWLHEVSQGWALSINCGTHYPQCTFRDCSPQQAYADFCITPDLIGDVYLNVRSKPIRVGNNYAADGSQVGYSGDCMWDQQELTWEQVGLEAQMPVDQIAALAEQERTTVTKKIRRVFSESWELLRDSAKYCGATKLILNFPQYIHWSAHKQRGGLERLGSLHPKVRAYIDKMEDVTGLPVVLIGTGANHDDYINLGLSA